MKWVSRAACQPGLYFLAGPTLRRLARSWSSKIFFRHFEASVLCALSWNWIAWNPEVPKWYRNDFPVRSFRVDQAAVRFPPAVVSDRRRSAPHLSRAVRRLRPLFSRNPEALKENSPRGDWHLHGLPGDIDIRQVFELLEHARQRSFDVSRLPA